MRIFVQDQGMGKK